MTNLQKLETAIREALSELMELKPFTKPELELKSRHGINISQPYKHEIDILHLLRWLDIINDKHSFQYSITDTSLYTTRPFKTYKLDLSKPLLSQQSQEVIDELVKLIP